MSVVTRQIVEIDEEKCDGCGDCVTTCAEGAIQIIDDKAKLVADNLCDGIGNCLGICPQGAITVHERAAEAYDESAVEKHLSKQKREKLPVQLTQITPTPHSHGGGCPGSQLRNFRPEPVVATASGQNRPSMLGQWPVQLTLLPPAGSIWDKANVLIAADCVSFAMADFHETLLAGKTLAIACPKLDDTGPYVDKLAHIFGNNDVRSIEVAIMEVPCCRGLLQVVMDALQQSGKDIPVEAVVIGVRGTVDQRMSLGGRAAAAGC
ncbi:MAG: hypothetical protein A2341_19970 [Deltaproteobacteria bacterium RIFOXYB12_FULL_58_9]|nr:MAG: hypothetical protein A2341_19970 [Deltaproteobacteria bacterium RIFOXYB12_FULL_58_9]